MQKVFMATDIGEYIVGAYLKLIVGCNVIDYNVRVPGGGLEGLNELDVIGLHFDRQTAYICEVTTHIRGTLYQDNTKTVERVLKKHERQRNYAEHHLSLFPVRHYMFWSPYVPEGYITNGLRAVSELDLVINKKYTACIEELRLLARKSTHDTNNPFFRTLQILEHLR
jgi:Holliday junction resolvase-like predicted endonuclease